jgi:hypothetical protein
MGYRRAAELEAPMDDRKLVLERPEWSDRTRSLFRRLDESPALRAEFLRDPRAVLSEALGDDAGAAPSAAISAANRILYEMLSDPTPIQLRESDVREGEDESGRYTRLFQALVRRIGERRPEDELDALDAIRGFNVDAEIDVRTQIATRIEAELRAELEARLEAKLDSRLEAKLDTRLEARLDTRLEAELHTKLDTRLDARLEARLDTRLEAKLDAELRAQLETKLQTQLRTQVETQFETDLRAHLDTRIGIEIGAQAEAGLEGPGEIGRQQRTSASEHGTSLGFSRLDLQRVAGFIAARLGGAGA